MAITDKLTDIADAIRRKTGGSAKLSLTEMVTEIANISSGGAETCTVTLTVNDGAISEPEMVYVGQFGDGWGRISLGGMDQVSDCMNNTLMVIPLDYESDLSVQVTGDGSYEYRIGSALLFYIYGDAHITVGPY